VIVQQSSTSEASLRFYQSTRPIHSLHCLGMFKRSLIQSDYLPPCAMLDIPLIVKPFEADNAALGSADADVSSQPRSFGGYSFLRTQETSVERRQKSLLRPFVRSHLGLPAKAELRSLTLDAPASAIDDDLAEARLSPQVIAAIRTVPITGRAITVDGFLIDA
jgi:hypothetical protein